MFPKKDRARTSLTSPRVDARSGRPSTAPASIRPTTIASRRTPPIVRDRNRFGANSPAWTIGSSRKPPKPLPDTPAPCQYDPPIEACKTQVTHTIQARESPNYGTITTNVEFPDLREFPSPPLVRIHEHDGTSFIPKVSSPGPSYSPSDVRRKHDYTSHKIEELHRVRRSPGTPGPADYEPIDPGRPTSPLFAMPQAPVKRFHDEKVDPTPGPGEYQIGPEVRRPATWTERLRVTKRFEPLSPIMIQNWES
jgi:hypothetical protein